MAITREPGYYWVKENKEAPWVVAQWNGTDWFYCGNEEDWPDNNYAVGPKIEPPA